MKFELQQPVSPPTAGVLFALIGLRFIWQANPGLIFCILFWAVGFYWILRHYFCCKQYMKIFWSFALIGFLCNAVATISNGGYMPVLGRLDQTSLWVPLTEQTNLWWLCDIHWGKSIGDFFLFSGAFYLIIFGAIWLLKKLLPKYEAEELTA